MKPPLILSTLLMMMASLLMGCKVGPNYRKPLVTVPTVYHGPNDNPEDQAQGQAASFADLPWWQVFQDTVLQDLIRRTLKQNYDGERCGQ
jgi:multidrug efflux system outer membrane protein